MYQHLFPLLSILASTSTIRASENVISPLSHSTGPTVLRPIHIANYDAALGLHPRASEDFSHLNLQTQSKMIYGSPGDNGQLLLAHMTLYAPDGLLMIMMERFEGLTSSVDCKGDDGTMSLTFNSENAFNHALQEWSYINQNDNGTFLLIANHEGCGPADERQPYFISKVTEDTATLTTHLAAKPAPWPDVAGTYDLDFGQNNPYPHPQRLKERGWPDLTSAPTDFGNVVTGAESAVGGVVAGVTSVAANVMNGATSVVGQVLPAATSVVGEIASGAIDTSKSFSVPVNVGQQGQRTNIYTEKNGGLILDCTNCFMTGSFEVTGHISVKDFQPKDLVLTASPKGVQAELGLEATISSTATLPLLKYSKELFAYGVPGAGVAVTNIFSIGVVLSYDVIGTATVSGSGTVDFGLKASLPDSAKLTADIVNKDSSSATGFSGGSLDPNFDITKGSASITLNATSQPKLSFGIELVKVENIDVEVIVKLPEVSATLTAAYDEAGVCSHDAGASKTGVKLSSEANIAVDLQINDQIGKSGGKPAWSKELFAKSEPLPSKCFPVSIPGLDKSSKTMTTSASTNSAVGTASSYVGVPSSIVASAPGTTPMPSAAVPTTTNVPSASITHVKRGSSGCRLARRHGKRMLIC